MQKEERERRQRRTATDEQSKERGNSKATLHPLAIQRPHELIQRPKKTTACNSRPRPPNATYLAKEGAWLGRPASRLNGLSQAPSPPSIYYMHHRGNNVVQDTVHSSIHFPPTLHNYLPVLGGQPTRAPSLDKLSRAAVCTKKKPAAAQPRNSPQELQLTNCRP